MQKALEIDPVLLNYEKRLDEYLGLLIHQALLHLGFEPGVVDETSGDQDGRLSESIKSFQADAGLEPTGAPSLETYLALKNKPGSSGRHQSRF